MSTPLAPFTFTGIGQVSKPEPRWNDKAGKAFYALNLTFTKPGSQYPSTISLDCTEVVYNAVVDGSFIEITASADGSLGAKGVFNKFWLHKWAAAKPPVASMDELSVEDLERLLAEKRAAAANPAPVAAPATTAEPLDDLPF